MALRAVAGAVGKGLRSYRSGFPGVPVGAPITSSLYKASAAGSVYSTPKFPVPGGRCFLSNGQKVNCDSKFEAFEKLYKEDRLLVIKGLLLIIKQTDQTDFVQKLLIKTPKLKLSEGLVDGLEDGIGKAWTVVTYAAGFIGWGLLLFLGIKTVKENDIPVSDYFDVLNAVRAQALYKGIAHYKDEKKAEEAAAAKKAEEAKMAKGSDGK